MQRISDWGWLGIVLVLFGIIAILIADSIPVIPQSVIQSIGTILIASGTIEIGLVWMTSRDMQNTLDEMQNEIESDLEENLQKPLEAFYVKREDSPHIIERAEEAESLWLAWHSGSRTTIQNIATAAENNADLKLILNHPNSGALEEVAKNDRSGNTLQALKEDIRSNTKIAQAEGFEVKWISYSLHNSINIVNPNHEGALAEIDLYLPFRPPEERPSIAVTPASGEVVYNHVKEMYINHLWEQAETPEVNHTTD